MNAYNIAVKYRWNPSTQNKIRKKISKMVAIRKGFWLDCTAVGVLTDSHGWLQPLPVSGNTAFHSRDSPGAVPHWVWNQTPQ